MMSVMFSSNGVIIRAAACFRKVMHVYRSALCKALNFFFCYKSIIRFHHDHAIPRTARSTKIRLPQLKYHLAEFN